MDEEKFGISESDKQILDRLKSNRDAKLDEKDDKPFSPVIIYKNPDELSKGEQRKIDARERYLLKREGKLPKVPKAALEAKEQPSVKTSSDKKPMLRGTTTPEISFDDNGSATYIWKRYYTKKNQILVLPKAIELDGMVSLEYSPQSKELVIRALQDTPETTKTTEAV